ncbi:hypothetical protein ASF77_23285 [Massilia sp. Leaf139]|nr:hypothetical protein ASF77_23285 [Massilia sp. Leaf139]
MTVPEPICVGPCFLRPADSIIAIAVSLRIATSGSSLPASSSVSGRPASAVSAHHRDRCIVAHRDERIELARIVFRQRAPSQRCQRFNVRLGQHD